MAINYRLLYQKYLYSPVWWSIVFASSQDFFNSTKGRKHFWSVLNVKSYFFVSSYELNEYKHLHMEMWEVRWWLPSPILSQIPTDNRIIQLFLLCHFQNVKMSNFHNFYLFSSFSDFTLFEFVWYAVIFFISCNIVLLLIMYQYHWKVSLYCRKSWELLYKNSFHEWPRIVIVKTIGVSSGFNAK